MCWFQISPDIRGARCRHRYSCPASPSTFVPFASKRPRILPTGEEDPTILSLRSSRAIAVKEARDLRSWDHQRRRSPLQNKGPFLLRRTTSSPTSETSSYHVFLLDNTNSLTHSSPVPARRVNLPDLVDAQEQDQLAGNGVQRASIGDLEARLASAETHRLILLRKVRSLQSALSACTDNSASVLNIERALRLELEYFACVLNQESNQARASQFATECQLQSLQRQLRGTCQDNTSINQGAAYRLCFFCSFAGYCHSWTAWIAKATCRATAFVGVKLQHSLHYP